MENNSGWVVNTTLLKFKTMAALCATWR